MRRHHSIRAHWRYLRIHHHATLHRAGRTGIYGEVGYHVAELGGYHAGLMIAAMVILLALLAELMQGGQ